MSGENFCENHWLILQRVKAAITRRRYNADPRPRPLPSSVTVTHTEPSPRKRSPKLRPPKTKADRPSAIYRARIVDALKDGPLWSVALAKACSTDTNCGTYGRVRRRMVQEGVIIEGEQRGRERPYWLATAT